MSHGSSDVVAKILSYARRIAVVGLSADPWRPSYGVASALLERGYEIVPVNPTAGEILGARSYPSLADVPGDVDVVDVFRRPQFLEDVAREAAAVGAKGLWLQAGLRSDRARRICEGAGMDYVEDLCLKVEVIARGRFAQSPVESAR